MVFHRTPFEHIKGKIQKFHAIIDPNFKIKLPDFASEHASDIIKVHNYVIAVQRVHMCI